MEIRTVFKLLTLSAVVIGLTAALPLSGQSAYARSVLINDRFEVNYDGWTNHGGYTWLTAVSGMGYNSARGMMVTNRKSQEDGAAAIMNFCAQNNIHVRGHVLVWHGQTPASFKTNGRSNVSLRKIPAGMYIVEARQIKNGMKMMSNVILR
jgi:GH35 family endo-1,4-beta-xylanase